MILLFLTGFALGAILITLGWASDSHPIKKNPAKQKTSTQHADFKKGRKAVAPHKASRPASSLIASCRMIQDAVPVPGRLYRNPEGLYTFRYPSRWQVNAKDGAMIVKSPGSAGVFGIVRRPDDQPNEQAVNRLLVAPNRPQDLTLTPARLAGISATKLIGSKKEDPYIRTVEYYLQHPNGHQYYILLQAPRNEWNKYSIAFGSMLRTLSFN